MGSEFSSVQLVKLNLAQFNYVTLYASLTLFFFLVFLQTDLWDCMFAMQAEGYSFTTTDTVLCQADEYSLLCIWQAEEYWFVCNRWFAKGEDDDKIVRELLPTTEDGQPLDTGLQGQTRAK